MSPPTPHNPARPEHAPGPARDVDPALTPEAARDAAHDPRALAREQFIHGLTAFLHLDPPETQRARVARVASAMAAAAHAPGRHPRRLPRFSWRIGSGAVALLTIVVCTVLMIPSTTSATALVQSSIDAARNAAPRRYEVRVSGPGNADASGDPVATIDIAGEDRFVIEALTPPPFREKVSFGRDEQGEWSIRPDGSVERGPRPRAGGPRGPAPSRWVDIGESTVLVESVEELLSDLPAGYSIDRAQTAPLPASADATLFNRITAVRRQSSEPRFTPDPSRIEIWIDRDSRLVKRLELHWPEGDIRRWREGRGGPDGRPRGGPGGPTGGPAGPDGRPRGGPDHHEHDHDFGPGPRRGGGPSEMNKPEPRPGMRPEMRPDQPKGDEPTSGQRPERKPDGRGEFRGGPGGRRPPRHLEGPPDFNAGMLPPPPRMLVVQRVDAPAFSANWFSPEAHVNTPAPTEAPQAEPAKTAPAPTPENPPRG
ncbi:MAG: hypothetical protein ACT4PL_05980 [Phycisphaerales bacterium]